MNLLPKTEVDFAKTEYWNKFFKERGSKEFEWYGEFTELCVDLLKYLKKEDLILVIGCGNSMLSSDLFDFGYRNIMSIDISSVVVKQMQVKVGKSRPKMVFEQMDALNMTYEDEKFTVVLDKGTLDALMPSDTINDRERAVKLFSEINRVLRIGGRYIVISLLQSHILKELLNYFTMLGWMIRIIRCWDVEKKKIQDTGELTMPVFMIVCVKMRKVEKSKSILEVNLFVNGQAERISSKEEVMAVVEGLQKTILHCREVKGEIEIKFCKKDEENPRYSIHVVDISSDQSRLLKYAAFIVPHGRETEWMFGTPEGRKYLLDSSGFDRLAVIAFHRGQEYGSMNEIQDELRQTILQLAPCAMPTTTESPNVPYLTLGDGVGCRKSIYSGTSDYSGDLIVEEVEIEKETFRRLIFMSNQAVVQSEVKLIKASSKNKNKKKYCIDKCHVGSNHILYMSIPAAINISDKSSLSVAVIGLGGGGLCCFLHQLYPKAVVTAVELDPLVVELAEKYFGFQTNEQLKVVVEDGVDFLKKADKFDIVMFDVDSKEQSSAISCPPPEFVESTVLERVANILGDTGVFVTNVVSRVKAEHDKLINKVRKHFALLTWYDLNEDVNRILFASNFKNMSKSQWQQQIKDAATVLNKRAQEKLQSNDEFLDLYHLMNQLTI